MRLARWFFRERSLSKVAATYPDSGRALMARAKVEAATGIERRRVHLVGPFDRGWGRKAEPEGVGIARTAIRAHLTCAAIGLGAALALYVALRASDAPTIVSSPELSLVVMLFFGTVFGLMAGGVLTIRPDHEPLIASVGEATRTGHWTVVVHPVTRDELDRSMRALESTGAPVVRTL
jgi:hypothetical protein